MFYFGFKATSHIHNNILFSLSLCAGVQVYRIERSPLNGCHRSPWALKRVTRRADEADGTTAALFNARLDTEARTLRRLCHPNIVGFRELVLPQEDCKSPAVRRPALAMEMCDISLGDLLEQRLDERPGEALPAAHIRRVCEDIFAALDYLHSDVRLLHGDIKSHNVLVKGAAFEVCKLCDFGVSLPLNADGFVDVVRQPGAQYVGTGLWSAPETLIDANVRNVSSKADVFSMGLVIYECVALMPPHLGVPTRDEEDDDDDDEDADASDKEDAEEELYNYEDSDAEEGEEVEYGTRPPLPECAKLGAEYNVVVEIFYICTNEEPEDRPSAGTLAKMLKSNSD